jgi:hypothetical protein
MKKSLSSSDKWTDQWVTLMVRSAHNNDLSSREIDSRTNRLVEQSNPQELGDVIKTLLNEMRIYQKHDLNQYVVLRKSNVKDIVFPL